MKKIGIVGGLGPLATGLFYQMITRLTRAKSDQEHVELVIYSAPWIPDRSAFLRGEGDNPLPGLRWVCSILEGLSGVIAIPCMTAHHFYDEIADAVSIPVLDMHRICAEDLGAVSTLGVLATDGTVISGRLRSILNNAGIATVFPESQEPIMRLIYAVKAGEPLDYDAFRAEASALSERGAEKVLLGCTELSAYAGTPDAPPLCDALEFLARRCILAAGGTVVD
jgi:aspartate racemase